MDLTVIIAVVVVALVFDYINGFHDAANAIATSVTTKALTPRVALVMAAVLNFVGALLGERVARTVTETISPGAGSAGLLVVVAGLLGAIGWNLLTWWWGLPSSSTHALIGGLVGAAVAAGVTAHWDVVLRDVVLPMVVSPVVAFGAALLLMLLVQRLFARVSPTRVYSGFRLAQTLSAAGVALGHGLQDAQKTMGVIFLALVSGGYVTDGDPLPLWVVLSAATALAAGTYVGGWRVIRTLGQRLIDLDPPRGFVAESVASGVLYTAAYAAQAPISTTHTVTSAVGGAGAAGGLRHIRWRVARRIGLAWLFTFPGAALLAVLAHLVLRLLPV
ncbi:MAG: anion permease [Nocardioides sp.]|nr:anion permease [Nocardioides sp.]